MFDEKKGLRLMIQIILALLLGAVAVRSLAANAFPQGAPKPTAPAAAPLPIPCCIITAINKVPADMVTAQVTATGQTFQFKVNDSALVKSMRVGEAVWANFKTGQVSVDGRTICGTIVAVSLAPAREPANLALPSRAPSGGAPGATSTQPGAEVATTAAGGLKAPSPAKPTVNPPPPCCFVARVDLNAGLATGQVKASPTIFEFKPKDPGLLQSIKDGQPLWANFKTGQVSLNGQTACCRIVSVSPQQASRPGLMAPAGAAPGVGAAGSSSAISAPASAGHPKTEAAPVTPGGLAGLKQAGPAINLPAPPQIQNFGVFPGPIPGGQEDVGQVVLTNVPANGIAVQLSSDQPAIASVPAQVQVSGSGPSAGSAVIEVKTSPVSRPTDVTLSAQIAGSAQVSTTKLNVRPPQPSILQCSPTSVISGTPIACKVWLDGPAPATLLTTVSSVRKGSVDVGGLGIAVPMQIQIRTNNSQVASVPGGTISIPSGTDQANFLVPTTAFPDPVDVVVSASYQGSPPQSAGVKLTPAAIRSFGCLTGLVASSVSPGSTGNASCEARGGSESSNHVAIVMTFSGPTPAAFVNVSVVPVQPVPPFGVTVPAGLFNMSFNAGVVAICSDQQHCGSSLAVPLQIGAKWGVWDLMTQAVSVPTTVTLSAPDPLSGLVKSIQVKIDPPGISSFGCLRGSGPTYGSAGDASCEILGDPGTPPPAVGRILMSFTGPTPAGFFNVNSDSGVVSICYNQYPSNVAPQPDICLSSLAVPLQTGDTGGIWDLMIQPVSVPTTVTLSAPDLLSGSVKTVQLKVKPPSPHLVGFPSPWGSTSISNVLAGGQQVQTVVYLDGFAPDSGITFNVKYSASDAGGNPLQGAVTGPAQFTAGPSTQVTGQPSIGYPPYSFNINVQPCEVNAPCKVSVTVGSATGTLYVNP